MRENKEQGYGELTAEELERRLRETFFYTDKIDETVYRELERLRASLEAAWADGFRKFILFLHYPPTSILEDDSGFTAMAEEYGAEQVVYAHSHGESRFHDSIQGEKNGVRYSLVSGDYRKWQPLKLLD